MGEKKVDIKARSVFFYSEKTGRGWRGEAGKKKERKKEKGNK